MSTFFFTHMGGLNCCPSQRGKIVAQALDFLQELLWFFFAPVFYLWVWKLLKSRRGKKDSIFSSSSCPLFSSCTWVSQTVAQVNVEKLWPKPLIFRKCFFDFFLHHFFIFGGGYYWKVGGKKKISSFLRCRFLFCLPHAHGWITVYIWINYWKVF